MPMMSQQPLPLNFADLAPNPVPWDAWISQETCYTHQDYPECQTITQEAYRPWIVYPDAFGKMDGKWSKCVSGIFGIMDPPTALQTVDEVVKPTMPSVEIDPTRTATKGQDPATTKPKATASTGRKLSTNPLEPLTTMTRDPKALLSTLSENESESAGHAGETAFSSITTEPLLSKESLPVARKSTTKDTVVATFMHESTRITMSGYVDDSGTSLFTYSSETLRFDGQTLTKDGTTYSMIDKPEDFGRTSLPTVVSPHASSSPVATSESSGASSSIPPGISVRPAESSSGVKKCVSLVCRVLAVLVILIALES